MRDRMMRLGHADVRIGPRARLARHLERDDARHVGLQRQHLQIEHQPDVVFPHRRDAGRPIEIGQRRASLCSARWMRRSTSRTESSIGRRGRDRRRRARVSGGPVAGHPVEDAAALLSSARRRSGLPPSPNSRSKTTRGSASVGSGVVGDDHDRLFW